jgi:hypothetical protein
MAIPTDPEALLGRRDGADALTEAGYPTAEATLATKAVRGGGPIYRRYGHRVIYRWGDLLDWAQSRVSPPMRSTSEADAGCP